MKTFSKNIIKLLFLLSFILASNTNLNAQNEINGKSLDSLINMSLEELMQINVISASRDTNTSIITAPSVISVITARQIELQGLKTVEEVLQRIPGFFTPHHVAQAQIVSRGIVQDQNINYLLLIDGHSQNSITVYGMDNQHIYPFLSNVERIEIIRGAGSTLWGSDALMGIINIITKTGATEDKKNVGIGSIKTAYNYQIRDNQQTGYIQYAKQFNNEYDIMLSYVNTRSKGQILPQYYGRFDTNTEPIPNPNGLRVDAFRNWPVTQEAYLNAHLGDFRILGRLSDQHVAGGQETSQDLRIKSDRVWQQKWVEGVYNKKLTSRLDIEGRLFYDYIKQDRNISDDPNTTIDDSYYDRLVLEEGYGAEAISHYKLKDLKILAGARFVERLAQGGIRIKPGNVISKLNSERGLDQSIAVFGEAEYLLHKKIQFTAGCRLDKHTLRDTKLAILPRFAAIYFPSDEWVFKYLFNTGIMRPTMSYLASGTDTEDVSGTFGIGTNKSSQTYSNDLQIIYKKPTFVITNTIFYTHLKNFTTFINANPDKINYGSFSPINSYGIEIEAEKTIKKKLTVYGNFSYCYSKFAGTKIYTILPDPIVFSPQDVAYNNYMKPDRSVMGVPRFLWNIGGTFMFTKQLSLNLHSRGWAVAWERWTNKIDDLHNYGPVNFIDFNLLYKNCFVKDLDFSIYGKNVLDSIEKIPTFTAGYNLSYGAAIGVTATYGF